MQHEIPDGDYKLCRDGLWLTFSNLSIRINPCNEGVDIAVYAKSKEAEEPLRAVSVLFDDAQVVLDSFSQAKDAILAAKQKNISKVR